MDEHTFDTGAKRSKTMPRYDLIPQIALVRLAARFEMGLKYGEHNYKLGLPFDDTLNHVIDHLLNYKERRKEYLRAKQEGNITVDNGLNEWMTRTQTDGDDLAGALWGIVAIMYLENVGRLS